MREIEVCLGIEGTSCCLLLAKNLLCLDFLNDPESPFQQTSFLSFIIHRNQCGKTAWLLPAVDACAGNIAKGTVSVHASHAHHPPQRWIQATAWETRGSVHFLKNSWRHTIRKIKNTVKCPFSNSALFSQRALLFPCHLLSLAMGELVCLAFSLTVSLAERLISTCRRQRETWRSWKNYLREVFANPKSRRKTWPLLWAGKIWALRCLGFVKEAWNYMMVPCSLYRMGEKYSGWKKT